MTHTRTIVLSDAHGHPQLIESVLEASGYRQGADRLVFAGDFLDRGDRAGECLALLDEAGAEMLWGNHDVAALLDWPISPRNAEGWALRDELRERFEAGERALVATAGDVLISHAGISVAYLADWAACGMEPAALAELVNAEFREAVEACLCGQAGQCWDDMPRVLGDLGPLWARPTELGRKGYLRGVRQVLGHTPVPAPGAVMLSRAGLHCVDPGVALMRIPGMLPDWRYAVVESGRVELVFEHAVSLLAS